MGSEKHGRAGRWQAFLTLAACGCACSADAQRVQIPNNFAAPGATPAFDPYAVGPPPATTLPYSYPSPGTLVPGQTYSVAPSYSAPGAPLLGGQVPGGQLPGGQALGGPAPFSPGAAPTTGGLFGGAPTTAGSGLFPNAPSVEWQRGSYSWQSDDGSVATFTKLLHQLSIDHAYLWGESTDPTDLELNETEVSATFAYPLGGNIETPLLITPGFAFNLFDGPIADPGAAQRGPDIPSALYDAYLDASWFPHPLPAFSADLGARVGVYSDFDSVNADSVRVLGRGLGVLQLTPALDLVLGVVYLDRIDISLLPAGGFHFRPNEVWDFYAVFPSPRVTRRLEPRNNLLINWFVAGEYGGGSWTADRAGRNDRFDYNDLRVTTGFEWETPRQRRGSIEFGYVFDRELVFASNDPREAAVDDTFIIRLGVAL